MSLVKNCFLTLNWNLDLSFSIKFFLKGSLVLLRQFVKVLVDQLGILFELFTNNLSSISDDSLFLRSWLLELSSCY